MSEARVIRFEGGAVFLAAQGLQPDQIAGVYRAARFVTGNASQPEVAEDALFQQLTDRVDLRLFNMYSGIDTGEPQEMTPEDLVVQGFPEQAVINGLKAAKALD